MTMLQCGNCGSLADEHLNTSWFDGKTEAEVTVGCSECGAETVYGFVEPVEREVFKHE